MKKVLHVFVALAVGISLGFNISVIAGDITANGMYQGDRFTYFDNIKDIVNEIKTDLNAATAELNGAATFDDITGFTFGTVAADDLTLTGL